MEQQQQLQQQQHVQLLQPQVKPQSTYSWVYNDLPHKKLKILAIIQIVIGSICSLLNIVSWVTGNRAELGIILGFLVCSLVAGAYNANTAQRHCSVMWSRGHLADPLSHD